MSGMTELYKMFKSRQEYLPSLAAAFVHRNTVETHPVFPVTFAD